MILTYEFTVPAATPLSTPYRKQYDMGVDARTIKSVKVLIPKGHKGLAYCKITTPGAQILPAINSNVPYIRGDDTTIETGVLNINVQGIPYLLYVEGYNDDDYLPHSFIINVEV